MAGRGSLLPEGPGEAASTRHSRQERDTERLRGGGRSRYEARRHAPGQGAWPGRGASVILENIRLGEGEIPTVLLHGFLGSGRNLRSLAAAWSEADPRRRFLL